ncbi:MAG: hypothetical protein U0K95_02190 [Eubacterium sp.]|nr:hypothetical protein [Eubacterium sp.]
MNKHYKINRIRESISCNFNEAISKSFFLELCKHSQKTNNRITKVYVNEDYAEATFTVESITQYSTWIFKVNFNNWGNITSRYWLWSENEDSEIPNKVAANMSMLINKQYEKINLIPIDYQMLIRKYIGDELKEKYKNNDGLFLKLLKRMEYSSIEMSSKDINDSYVYPVLALILSRGFRNVLCIPIKDIDKESRFDEYKIEHISISGAVNFEKDDYFRLDSKINIYYHMKKEIKLKKTLESMKCKNVRDIAKYFHHIGFSNVNLVPIYDLKLGLFIKNDSIDRVEINCLSKDEKGSIYEYDAPIFIYYHTFKSRREKI